MVDLDEAIFYSKLIIKNGDYYSGKSFRKYSKGFIGTNENIKFYLEQEKSQKDRAFTVLAGGDHVFNLVFKGFREVDAFDINILQYFIFYLREAMINSLSYKEFLSANAMFFSVYLEQVRGILEKVQVYLRDDVYEYYRKILEFAQKCGRFENLYYMVPKYIWKNNNNYLANETAYYLLREKLKDVKVDLCFGDIRSLNGSLKGEYDVALLSNITDYLGKEKSPLTLKEFNDFLNPYCKLLSDNGVLIDYLYGFKDEFLIKNSVITRKDIPNSNLVRIGDTNQGYYRVRKLN